MQGVAANATLRAVVTRRVTFAPLGALAHSPQLATEARLELLAKTRRARGVEVRDR